MNYLQICLKNLVIVFRLIISGYSKKSGLSSHWWFDWPQNVL